MATSAFSLHLNNKDPISYEIQILDKQITLPREDVMTNIASSLETKQNLNFVALIGEKGIGKTVLARRYIRNNDFAVKGEIDASNEESLIKSFESLCFLLCESAKDKEDLKDITNLSNAFTKRSQLKSFLSKRLSKHGN